MNIQLKKPLAFFDLETTGTTIGKDRIVEIAIIKLLEDGTKEQYVQRINPEIPIPLVISEIHGIYDFDIKDAPKFEEVAEEIKSFIKGCDLAGYNSNRFDVPFLYEEFYRVGIDPNEEGRKLVDVQNIFHKMEQRTLAAAYKFYCNKEIINAHSALADTEATFDVLIAQLDKYNELENNIDFLSEFSEQTPKTLDFARRIAINEDNIPVFNFGKHKGRSVVDVLKKDKGYYSWIMNGDFPNDTKMHIKKIKESLES